MGVAAAIAGAAVVGAGTSIYSSSKASSTASKAAANSNALQASIYDSNKATLSPFVDSGTAATEQIRRLLGLGDSNTGTSGYSAQEQQTGALGAFMNTGSYSAGLDQGLKNIQAVNGAKGYSDSGAAQKSLLSYGENYLGTSLNNYISQLSGLSSQGAGAASALTGNGTNYANAVSANNASAANTSANASLASGGAVNSALGSALSAYTLSQGLGSSYGTGTTSSGTPPIYGGNLGGIY